MIQAHELRIGNLVNIEATTHRIESIDRWRITSYWMKRQKKQGSKLSTYKVYDEALYRRSLSEVKPIPLTEEWLLKFGFVKVNDNMYRLNGYSVIYWNNGWHEFAYNGFIISNICRYVHTLQNLYFCLTGEELKLKES